MRSSIISISLICAIGALATPVASRPPKALQQHENPQNGNLLLDSNAIPSTISEHLMSFFSTLTPGILRSILNSGRWAEEMPYEFQADPDVETKTQGYQGLYNDFLESRKRRL